eukprot:14664845-Heterocapsa_arctica.AAC.1
MPGALSGADDPRPPPRDVHSAGLSLLPDRWTGGGRDGEPHRDIQWERDWHCERDSVYRRDCRYLGLS